MRSRSLFLLSLAALLWGAELASAGTLTVSFDTTSKGGNYSPRNVVAVWIQNSSGQLVKTIGRWAGERRNSLVSWSQAAGAADADAVSGATRANHGRLSVTWDGRNRAGVEVPDDTYTVRLELADRNSVVPTDNHQGSFAFVKGLSPVNTNVSGNGFNNVNIIYTPGPTTCNNGVIDANETCDPPGSCPTSCPTAADSCKPLQLNGAAATCTAVCVERIIRICNGGDNCCPAGCVPSNDSDCSAGGGGSGGGGSGDGGGEDDTAAGGCATGEQSAGLLLAVFLGLGVLVLRRRG